MTEITFFDESDEVDKTRTSTFNITINTNDRTAYKTDEEIEELANNYKELLRPLFSRDSSTKGDLNILKFILFDANTYNPEKDNGYDKNGKPKPKGGPNSDPDLFIPIYDFEKSEWTEIDGVDLYDTFIKQPIRCFVKNVDEDEDTTMLHVHVVLQIKHDKNILINMPLLNKWLSNQWLLVTGVQKFLHTEIEKRQEYFTTAIGYSDGDKKKRRK